MANKVQLELLTETDNGYTSESFNQETSKIPVGEVSSAISEIENQCKVTVAWKGITRAAILIGVILSGAVASGIFHEASNPYLAGFAIFSSAIALFSHDQTDESEKKANMWHPLNGDQNPPQYLRRKSPTLDED